LSDGKKLKTLIENTPGLGPGWYKAIVQDRNYSSVLPINFSDFMMPSILPMVFYLFDTGKRRGRGALK